MLRANSLKVLSEAICKKDEFTEEDELLKYMHNNKTKCALEIFNTDKTLKYPKYIEDALAAL